MVSIRAPAWTMKDSSHLPLWSISKGQNELEHQEEDVAILQEIVDNGSCFVTKGPSVEFVGLARSSHKIHNNGSGQPERSYQ